MSLSDVTPGALAETSATRVSKTSSSTDHSPGQILTEGELNVAHLKVAAAVGDGVMEKGKEVETEQPLDASIWQLAADAFDELLGIRNNPDRLLTLTNTIMLALIASSTFLLVTIPSKPARGGFVAPSFFAEGTLLTRLRRVANSPSLVRYLLFGFIVLALFLTLLINIVGRVAIQAWKADLYAKEREVEALSNLNSSRGHQSEKKSELRLEGFALRELGPVTLHAIRYLGEVVAIAKSVEYITSYGQARSADTMADVACGEYGSKGMEQMECGTGMEAPVKMGTTILAMKHSGGVMLAADGLTSVGMGGALLMADRFARKLVQVTDNVWIGRMGSAADTQLVCRHVKHYMRLHRIELSSCGQELQEVAVKTVASIVKLIRYNNRDMINGNFTVAGVDSILGPQIYSVRDGFILEKDFLAGGSGMALADALAGESHDPKMSKEEAFNLLKRMLTTAHSRDSATGGDFRFVNIPLEGKTETFHIPARDVPHFSTYAKFL